MEQSTVAPGEFRECVAVSVYGKLYQSAFVHFAHRRLDAQGGGIAGSDQVELLCLEMLVHHGVEGFGRGHRRDWGTFVMSAQ